MSSPIVFLGPQRFNPTLAAAVDFLGIEGKIATVTAGWQEREAEDDELSLHLGSRTVNLLLHRRSDEVFQKDREFAAAHRLRQETLRQLQDVYRRRLTHAKEAARELFHREGEPWLLDPERQAAVDAVRAIDAHHLARVREVNDRFDQTWRPHDRPVIAQHRAEIGKILDETAALAVAGGHVAVLLNRLGLFGVIELAGERPVVAWSAGAMVLAATIVLFHDNPPQGAGNAEVLGEGLDLFPRVLPLPHASKRLRLDDAVRVSLLARRFAPSRCVALDQGSRIFWDGASLVAGPGTCVLTPQGGVEEMVGA